MKQLKVALPDSLRDLLEESAERTGRSLADEVRTRLERTFGDDRIDKPTRALLFAIEQLAQLVLIQTGQEWHAHPDANDTLLAAITSRFARFRPKAGSVAEPLHSGPLVASNDTKLLGPALEAIAFGSPTFECNRTLTAEQFQEFLNRMLEAQRLTFANVLGGIPPALRGPTLPQVVQTCVRDEHKRENS